jgi:hypothetical protein
MAKIEWVVVMSRRLKGGDLRILPCAFSVALSHGEFDLGATDAVIRMSVAELLQMLRGGACPAQHERRKTPGWEASGANTRAINMRADDLVAADGVERVLEVLCPLPPQNGAGNRHLIQGIISWMVHRDNDVACLRHRHSEPAHHLGSASEAVREQNDRARSAAASAANGASIAAEPTSKISWCGGPMTIGLATTPSAAGYQTVILSSVRCCASRMAAEGSAVVRWVSPTI